MTAVNSQRGVPYDPAASVRQRERNATQRSRELADKPQVESLAPRKAHAIMLDQVEAAWKERARDRGRS